LSPDKIGNIFQLGLGFRRPFEIVGKFGIGHGVLVDRLQAFIYLALMESQDLLNLP
jgi:hypothetical protein